MKVLCVLACVLGAALGADEQHKLGGSGLLHRSETALRLVNTALGALADEVKNSNLSPEEEALQKRYTLVSFFFSELLVNFAYTNDTYPQLYDRVLVKLAQKQLLPAFELAQPALHLFKEFLVHTRQRSQALQKYCYLYKSTNSLTNETSVGHCRRVLQKYDDFAQTKHTDHKRVARLHDLVLDNVYLFEKFGNLLAKVRNLDYGNLLPFLKGVKHQVRKAVERLSYAFQDLEAANEKPCKLNLRAVFYPYAQ